MKILIFWDIYWRIWRKALSKELPNLKLKYKPDFIIVNADNVTSWRWPIEKHILEIEELWIDIITWWDHIFDNEDKIVDYINREDSILLRPANFYDSTYYKTPWKGYKIVEKQGKRLLVIHLIGEVFMKYSVSNPFLKLDEILNEVDKKDYDAVIVDFHKEATAEWQWLAHFIDWKVWFLYWTHTHVQTNDDIVLNSGTWFISDIWMIWSIDSVIWADFDSVKKRFLTWLIKWRIKQKLDNDYLLNAVCVDINDKWFCDTIEKIKIKGIL